MVRLEMISPIKITPRNASAIVKYVERQNIQFMLRIKNKNYMIRMNSIIGLLSSGVKKGDDIIIYCDKETPYAELKLAELQKELESLA